MRQDYISYLGARQGDVFQRDLFVALKRLFGAHGYSVRFSYGFPGVYQKWVSLAAQWSMRIPDQHGNTPTAPNPLRVSHIKHAGILSHVIASSKPIAAVEALKDEDKALFLAQEWPHSYKLDEGLLKDFPQEYPALVLVEAMFVNYEIGRAGDWRFEPTRTPMTYHYRRNQCLLFADGHLSPEAMYLIFKTMDLFGYVPTTGERVSQVEIPEPSGDH